MPARSAEAGLSAVQVCVADASPRNTISDPVQLHEFVVAEAAESLAQT